MNWRRAYDAFCQEVADLPIFAQSWYLDAVCQDGEWAAAIVQEGDRTVAIMPYFIKKKWGFSYATQPLFTKHLGPFLAPDKRRLKDEFRYYQKLIEQLPKLDGFVQECSPQLSNWLPFYYKGFRQTTRYTYQLDLQTDIAVEVGFNRNIRRNLRKADALLTLSHDLGLDQFWQLNQLSFQRQGLRPPYSFALLKKHDQALAQHDARQMFFALDQQNNIHSAAYLIRDRQKAYYHLSGDDPDFRESGSGIWLTYQAILHARDVWQVPIFDFEGSMLPAVEAIRRQFGAKQEAYFRLERIDNRLFGFLQRIRK